MPYQPGVPAFKACTQSPNVQIRDLRDDSRAATDSGRDDDKLRPHAEASASLRPIGTDPGPCSIDRNNCFRLVGKAAGALTEEQQHIAALVRLGWYWKEPGVLARPWDKRIKSFWNPEGE